MEMTGVEVTFIIMFIIPMVIVPIIMLVKDRMLHIRVENLKEMNSAIKRHVEIEEQLRQPHSIQYTKVSHAEGPLTAPICTGSHIPTNCPNCGAVVDPYGHKCEYCDTPYSWAYERPVYKNDPEVDTYNRLSLENKLLEVKLDALRQQEITKQLYEEALRAMRQYSQDL